MKANLRCKSDNQGDRCKKAKDHQSDLAIVRDPIHVGNFAAWKDNGELTLHMERESPRRNRRLNRLLRNINTLNLKPKVGIALLTSAIQYLRGNNAATQHRS